MAFGGEGVGANRKDDPSKKKSRKMRQRQQSEGETYQVHFKRRHQASHNCPKWHKTGEMKGISESEKYWILRHKKSYSHYNIHYCNGKVIVQDFTYLGCGEWGCKQHFLENTRQANRILTFVPVKEKKLIFSLFFKSVLREECSVGLTPYLTGVQACIDYKYWINNNGQPKAE